MKKIIIFILFTVFAAAFISAASWSSALQIWTYNAMQYFPPNGARCLVSDSLGVSHMIFYDNAKDVYFGIMYSYYNGTGWKWPARIEDGGSDYSGYYLLSWMPTISVEPDGKRMVVWEDWRSGDYNLYAKYNDNVQWSTQKTVTTTLSYSFNPKLNYRNGRHHLIFEDDSTGYFNIYYSYYDTMWHYMESILDTPVDCINSSFQVLDNNDISVIFTMPDGDYMGLYNVRREGGAWKSPVIVFTPGGDVLGTFIVIDGSREYALFTSSVDGRRQLFLSSYSSGSWGLPKLVTEKECDIYQPKAVQKDGMLHIVYVGNDNLYGTLYHTVYDMAADTFSTEEEVASYNQRNIYSPQITADATGRLVVAYVVDKGLLSADLDNHIFYATLAGTKSSEQSIEKLVSVSYEKSGISLSIAGDDEYRCRIIDKTGRVLKDYEGVKGGLFISSGDLGPAGIYFVALGREGRTFTKKIVWLK